MNDLPFRRQISVGILAAASFLGLGGTVARAAVATSTEPTQEELSSMIPVEMRPDRRAVPDEDNAALPLKTAMRRAAVPSPDVKEALAVLSAWGKTLSVSPDTNTPLVRSWQHENAEALRIFRSAAKQSQCLFPSPSTTNVAEGLNVLVPLARGLLIEARLLWRDGSRTEAITELRNAVVISGHLIRGARTLLHYLVASSVRRQALEAIHTAALSPDCSEADLRQLAAVLSQPPDDATRLRECIRSELSDYIVPTTRLEIIQANFAGIQTNTAALLFYPEELHRPLTLIFDPKLLASHPQPLDALKSMRGSVDHWTAVDRRLAMPWSTNTLPDDIEATRERFVGDFAPIEEELDGEDLPLSDEAVTRAAPLFQKMENPVGRLLASLPDFNERTHQRTVEAETRFRALATVIALRRWALDHGGALPDSLQVLVDAGQLPALPLDAFSGQPLHYSSRRELVWSVGPNARDDDGKRDAGFEGIDDDPSWSVTPGSRP